MDPKETNKISFCIEIDFQRESEAPSRVFRVLSDLIDAFQDLDRDLVASIDPKIQPVILLEDIKEGSVKTWLAYALNTIDDDAIKNLDWKKAVGVYLLKAKHLLIKFCENKTEISDKADLKALEQNLLQLATSTDVKMLPAYTPVSQQNIVRSLGKIAHAIAPLTDKDHARYIADDEKAEFNVQFNFVPEAVEELITREKIDTTNVMILKVKKPDYLGDSRWEFKYENKMIPAKISHHDWLRDFQNRNVDIRPGDSVKAKVHFITRYGDNLDVVSTHYEILEVIEVIPYHLPLADPLFPEE